MLFSICAKSFLFADKSCWDPAITRIHAHTVPSCYTQLPLWIYALNRVGPASTGRVGVGGISMGGDVERLMDLCSGNFAAGGGNYAL